MSDVYEYRVGRGKDCHMVVHNPFVSRDHARLTWNGADWSLRDSGSSNGTFVNDPEQPLPSGEERLLREGDIVYFSKQYKLPADLLLKRVVEGGGEESSGEMSVFEPTEGVIRIGRAPENDVVLPQLSVSRFHAEIHVRADGLRELRDLGSKGGTFVNNRQVLDDTVPISKDDRIEVGGVAVCIQFSGKPGSKTVVGRQREGIYLQVGGLGRRVKDRQTGEPRDLLRDISLSIYPGEFVGLMGPSGCGKTTFMTAINGCEPFTSGSVHYNGMDLTANLPRFAPQVGYVPQDDIMHPELTVREVLFYSARLKLGGDVSDEDINAKIDSVCMDLGLWRPEGGLDLRETLIGTPEQKTLSGGQKKRVNLAMELLTDPKILFLDEPTSGLSSADTVNVMELLRKMADERGIAIVITIHQPSTTVYKLMDKVIYLKTGRLCYFGPAFPDSISYFVPDQDPAVAGPDAVMERLDLAEEGIMESQFRKSSTYQELVKRRASVLGREKHGGVTAESRRVHPLAQLPGLFKRYVTCKLRDRGSLAILLAQAPVIGLLVGWIFREGLLNPPLFLLVFVSLWFGTNNSAKEIVGERGIFRREKRSGLSPAGYLASKLLVQGILTFLQCFLLVLAADVSLAFTFSFFSAVGICWLTSLAGIAVGLCVSAWSKTEITAIVAVPLILIPFILFGGLLKPYDDMGDFARFAAFFNPARWGYDAIVQLEREDLSGYAKSPKRVIKDLREALDAVEAGAPASSFTSDEEDPNLQAFHEEEDLRDENSGPGYRNQRKSTAKLMLWSMTCLAMFGCYFKVRRER